MLWALWFSAVLWALWLRRNKVIFKGRPALVESIVHDAEDFVSWWFRRE